ncbi:MAG: peptidoglycan DD-metalloendopeptidase family protein, partial [Cyclobacteriaceae bacterium]|nr:peptidoglycan DD-metalloendopeptidase family protein [Cyclobacteriaceae bacterium]
SLYAERIEREIEIVERSLSGIIEQSLSVTMDEMGITQELTNKFVDVFAWKIDFFALQKGDKFKIVYREKLIDGEPVGIDGISTIQFEHWGNEYYAFEFDQGEGTDYFDEEGKSIRKALLRYPLEFSRISSRYSLSRFHPVQKRYKAHLGTDFAAATGTPIRAVGDGIIVEAGFKQYNGNYVKLKHNATYTTQYLHMSKIASGIRSGVKVRQGQTIGYVGATGLATGSHLCYRFWKNGVQVDALKVEIPPSYPVAEENMAAFELKKNELKSKLDEIPALLPSDETIVSIEKY